MSGPLPEKVRELMPGLIFIIISGFTVFMITRHLEKASRKLEMLSPDLGESWQATLVQAETVII
jgi:hypothetical protein